MGKNFIVTQIKSNSGCTESQIKTLKALGLGRRTKKAVVSDNPANRGQVMKVQHLVAVEVSR
jgi:large subunit ribosomal protein L30